MLTLLSPSLKARTKKMELDVNRSQVTPEKKCTSTECTDADDINKKLKCSKCTRLVNFRCTHLPLYQIQRYLTFGIHYSKYVCVNCVNITKELSDLVEINIEEFGDYRVKYVQEIEKSANYKEEIARLNHLLSEKEKEVAKLNKSIQALESRVENVPGQTKRKRVDELIETSPTLIPAEKSLFEQMEKRFEEMQNNCSALIDDKFKHCYENTNNRMSYESTACKDIIEEQNDENKMKETTTKDLRSILLSTRNEEKAEQRDQKLRLCNIIVHGRKEIKSTEVLDDDTFVNMLLFDTETKDLQLKSVKRIGFQNTAKPRPIKITLYNAIDKAKIMKNLWKLKGKKLYKDISIKHDYTFTEREMIKEFKHKARERNSLEPENSNHIWKVRGDPKNGLVVKRYNRRQQSQ